MTAQVGSNVLLQYGAAGTQQPGSGVLLNFDTPVVSGTKMVGNRRTARWGASRGAMRPLDARHVATAQYSTGVENTWAKAEEKVAKAFSPWVKTGRTDVHDAAPWGKFGAHMSGEKSASWKTSQHRDDARDSSWGMFDLFFSGQHGAGWNTSKPADRLRIGIFSPHLIRTFVPVPWIPPAFDEVGFRVIGGSPMQIVAAHQAADLSLPINAVFSAALYTPHFLGNGHRSYFPPPGRKANFGIDTNRSLQLLVDANGQPVLTPSSRDSIRLNPWGQGKRIDKSERVPWFKYSRPMNPGWGIVVPTNPGGNENDALVVVPIRSIYMQVNTQTLVVASSGAEILANSLSVQIDVDSWVWGWSATVPASYLDTLQTTEGYAVEVIATINGTAFNLFVERISRSREFGKASLSIGGRGRAAWLAAPYHAVESRTNATARTAQQLMADALTINGVSNGWSVDWNLTDWTVPAGVWSHTGSPIEACLAIAQAAGGYIQADRTGNTLHVLPRYASAPWEWLSMVPDIELPENVCVTEGLEWVDKPAYNAVYVSGAVDGILGYVKRTGTDGGKAAPMVVDPLITHADAARQRGRAILSNTGRIKNITLSLPVLSETGIIVPGKTIKYTESGKTHLGIVRAVNVVTDFPKVRQSITVESHVV